MKAKGVTIRWLALVAALPALVGWGPPSWQRDGGVITVLPLLMLVALLLLAPLLALWEGVRKPAPIHWPGVIALLLAAVAGAFVHAFAVEPVAIGKTARAALEIGPIFVVFTLLVWRIAHALERARPVLGALLVATLVFGLPALGVFAPLGEAPPPPTSTGWEGLFDKVFKDLALYHSLLIAAGMAVVYVLLLVEGVVRAALARMLAKDGE